MKNSRTLGQTIALYREKLDLTQKELAEKLNIGKSTMSQYESDERRPSDEVKMRCSMDYNIPLRIKNLVKRTDETVPERIAKALGIHVRYVDTPSHINGFWKTILKQKFIFVNAELEHWQQQAVIAHELGHILLHPKYHHYCLENRSYYRSTRHENEADFFAIKLLEYSDIEPMFVDYFLKNGWE